MYKVWCTLLNWDFVSVYMVRYCTFPDDRIGSHFSKPATNTHQTYQVLASTWYICTYNSYDTGMSEVEWSATTAGDHGTSCGPGDAICSPSGSFKTENTKSMSRGSTEVKKRRGTVYSIARRSDSNANNSVDLRGANDRDRVLRYEAMERWRPTSCAERSI